MPKIEAPIEAPNLLNKNKQFLTNKARVATKPKVNLSNEIDQFGEETKRKIKKRAKEMGAEKLNESFFDLLKNKERYLIPLLHPKPLSITFNVDHTILLVVLTNEGKLGLISNIELGKSKLEYIIKMMNQRGFYVRELFVGFTFTKYEGENLPVTIENQEKRFDDLQINEVTTLKNSKRPPIMTLISGPFNKVVSHLQWKDDAIHIQQPKPTVPQKQQQQPPPTSTMQSHFTPKNQNMEDPHALPNHQIPSMDQSG